MKMTQEHYEALAEEIEPQARKHPYSLWRERGVDRVEWRWDLLFYALEYACEIGGSPIMYNGCEVLYEYLNDDHVDTALRRITDPIADAEGDNP